MSISRAGIFTLLLAFTSIAVGARNGPAIWDSRCEECHGEPAKFIEKYMWIIDGQLQGQHHVDNLDLFLSKHYVPAHEVEAIQAMLLAKANTSVRFAADCAQCHGDIKQFVATSLWVGKNDISGVESGSDVGDFLSDHQNLQAEDIIFYQRLFFRIAGKPTPSELISAEPGLDFR